MFGLGLKQLEQFCHQISLMLEAGVPLPRALNSLSNRGVAVATRPVVARIAREIEAGSSFTQAVERQGKIFPPLMRNLISAGEESGNLEPVMKRLAAYFELQREIRNKFIMRLIYPAVDDLHRHLRHEPSLGHLYHPSAALQESPAPSSVSPIWAAVRTFLTGMGIVGLVVLLYFL